MLHGGARSASGCGRLSAQDPSGDRRGHRRGLRPSLGNGWTTQAAQPAKSADTVDKDRSEAGTSHTSKCAEHAYPSIVEAMLNLDAFG